MPSVLWYRLLLLLVFPGAAVQAQFPGWEKLGSQQGLLSEESYHVFEDKKGYIWVSTEFGTQIFDGQHFRNPPGSPSPLPIVYAHSSDAKRDLLLFTSRGQFLRYNGDTFLPEPSSPHLVSLTVGRNSLVYDIRRGNSGRYYMFSNTGILSSRPGDPHVSFSTGQPRVQIFFQDGVWQAEGFYSGLNTPAASKSDAVTIEVRDFLPQPVYLQIPRTGLIPARYSVAEGREGLLIGLGLWLFLLKKEGTLQRWRTPKGVVFTQSIQGELYAGLYSNGLIQITDNLQNRQTQLEGLSVSSLYKDSTGRLWATTLESGLFRETQVGQFRHPGISGTITMLKALGNRIFVGTHEGNLWEWNAEGKLLSYPITGVGLGQVFDVVQTGDRLLASSNHGVFPVSLGGDRQPPILMKNNNRVTVGKFFLPIPGNRLLCTHTRGFSWIAEGKIELVQKTTFKTYQVAWFRNRVWVASDDGLRVFQIRGNTFREETPLFSGLRIMTLKTIRDQLWVSVLGKGLFRFSPDKAFPKQAEIALEKPVLDLAFSPSGQLVTAGLDGVYLYSPQARGGGFGPGRKLLGEKATQVLFWNQGLWMGTHSGLISMPWPEQHRQRSVPVYLRQFEENGVSRPFQSGMVLASSNERAVFHFDVLDYSPSREALVFQLLGPGKTQGHVENTRLTFQNLPPGDYELRVNYPVSSERKPRVFRFSVAYEFWETRWFQIPTGFILFLLVGLMTGATVRWYRRKDAEKNQIQRLLASYRTTALQSQMNPHFISNALSAIQNLILDNEVDKASLYLMKFYRMLRRVLDYSDKTFIRLSEELALIEGNVELEKLRFRQQFEFRVELGAGVVAEEIFVPSLITQPLVENAIWHGLLPLDGQRPALLVFRVKIAASSVQIDIEDNGVGRSPKGAADGNSRSLRMVKDRISNLNHWRKSDDCSFSIQDLQAADGSPLGTCATLLFPTNLHLMQDESLPD